MVEEIRYIRDTHGLIYFSIRDDTFTADRQRVIRFCQQLIEEKLFILWSCQSRVNAVDLEMLAWMKRAGCECIQYGIESGSQRILDVLGKHITQDQVRQATAAARKVGMNVSVYLITGVPGETERDLQRTLRLLEEIRAHDGQVSPLAYYPGTRFFENDIASGKVSRQLFLADRSPALFVRSDAFVARSMKMMLERLEQVATASVFTPEDYRRHKEYLGYCHATNVAAGDYYNSLGAWRKAQAEYLEILEREPENPWGWLLVGELHVALGDTAKAHMALERLLELVPASPGFPLDVH